MTVGPLGFDCMDAAVAVLVLAIAIAGAALIRAAGGNREPRR